MLGAQANNSSNYPADAARGLAGDRRRSTPTRSKSRSPGSRSSRSKGRFDFSWVDTLLRQARRTTSGWSCSGSAPGRIPSASYAPEWVKADTARFPRMTHPDGKTHYVLSPHGRRLCEADRNAFVRLMRHIRDDRPAAHRDHGPGRERDRQLPIAARFLARGAAPVRTARCRRSSRASRQVPAAGARSFGGRADQAFNAWYTARYVDEIAAAGQAELDLPMYCNAVAQRSVQRRRRANTAPSGGPQLERDRHLEGGRAAHRSRRARHLRSRSEKAYIAAISTITPGRIIRCIVPETGNAAEYARFFWPALGKRRDRLGAVRHGRDRLFQLPARRRTLDAETIEAFAVQIPPVRADRARLGAARLRASHLGLRQGRRRRRPVAQSWAAGRSPRNSACGSSASATGPGSRRRPNPNKDRPVGGGVVLQLGPDEFLVAGSDVRIRFAPRTPHDRATTCSSSRSRKAHSRRPLGDGRRWNGDQTDYGLNFTTPCYSRCGMGTYR